MEERSSLEPAEQLPRRRLLRLWHLAVAVLFAALVLGGIRALARETNLPISQIVSGVVVLSIMSRITCAFMLIGQKLGWWVGDGLTGWAVRRGGVVGFCARVVGVGIYIGLAVGTGVMAPIVIAGFVLWLLARFALVGRF